ncbi:sigma-70 family RNA polymerase sigma factor [Intrasporangium sp.]|uniref:RNA polymerase sigma factor n=1 Tax=Intrasporangium sp. TaxID=1925024 RepID=UPI003222104A
MSVEAWDDTVSDEDPASQDFQWVAALSAPGALQTQAMTELHALMLRAAGHQVRHMSGQLAGLDPHAIDVLINQSADEAMAAVIRKLDTFAGRSRFTTCAYKFAIVQAASDVRRAAWRDREVTLDGRVEVPDRAATPDEHAEAADLGRALATAMTSTLTSHQRRVAVALLVDHVPIDVLAERLATNRNALYKTLHDARARLREHLVASGHLPVNSPRRGRRVPAPHVLEGGLG